jgi:hypothetical protein
MRAGAVLLAAFFLGAGACVPPGAQDQPNVVCPEHTTWDGTACKSADVECPGGSRWNGFACIGTVECPEGQSFDAQRGCVAGGAGQDDAFPPPTRTTGAAAPGQRDTRAFVEHPRDRALLTVEIQSLKQLLQSTAPGAKDRPALVRRIAEDYVELEFASQREKDTKTTELARKGAIEHYAMLLRDHPQYPQTDEALYDLGLEYERSGDLANARATYAELARRFPSSPYLSRVPQGPPPPNAPPAPRDGFL